MKKVIVVAVGIAYAVLYFTKLSSEPPILEATPGVYPVYSEQEYLEKFAANPNKFRIADVRWRSIFPSGKRNRFANSLGDFRSPSELKNYLTDHQAELKDKEILFVCYGGASAQAKQQQNLRNLRSQGLNLDLIGFRPGTMLYKKPDWQAARVRYYPETLTDIWQRQGRVEIVALEVPADPTPEFWKSARKKLSGTSKPIVVRTDADPGQIELGIYPLESNRRYEIHDDQTPPAWFATGIHSLNSHVPYPLILSGLMLGMLSGLVSLRRLEVTLLPRPITWLALPMARAVTIAVVLTFVYFSSFCFVDNFWTYKSLRNESYEQLFAVLFFFFVSYRSWHVRTAMADSLARRSAHASDGARATPSRRLLRARKWAGRALAGMVLVSTMFLFDEPGKASDDLWRLLGFVMVASAAGLVVAFCWCLVRARERIATLWSQATDMFAFGRGFLLIPAIWMVSMRLGHEVQEPHQAITPIVHLFFAIAVIHAPIVDWILSRRLLRDPVRSRRPLLGSRVVSSPWSVGKLDLETA